MSVKTRDITPKTKDTVLLSSPHQDQSVHADQNHSSEGFSTSHASYMQGVRPLGWRAHQDCETLPVGPLSPHLELEPSTIRQTCLFRVDLSTDGLQVAVKLAIIKGAEFHLYCLCALDDPPWQAEERCQPMPGGLSIGSRKIGVARPHHHIGER
jgi:hypothetical protein